MLEPIDQTLYDASGEAVAIAKKSSPTAQVNTSNVTVYPFPKNAQKYFPASSTGALVIRIPNTLAANFPASLIQFDIALSTAVTSVKAGLYRVSGYIKQHGSGDNIWQAVKIFNLTNQADRVFKVGHVTGTATPILTIDAIADTQAYLSVVISNFSATGSQKNNPKWAYDWGITIEDDLSAYTLVNAAVT